MKRAYSEFIYGKSLKHCIGVTWEEVVESMWHNHDFCGVSSLDRNNPVHQLLVEKFSGFRLNTIAMETMAKTGHCLHLFFTGEGMHDWLKSCATPFTVEHFGVLRTVQAQPYVHDNRHNEGSTESRVVMLHFAGGESPCYLLMLTSDRGEEGFTGYIGTGRGLHITFNDDLKLAKTVDEETITVIGTVAAAISYMKCFPDTVINGVPSDVKHPNHFKGLKSQSVGMHKSLVVRDGPSPHYRSGHFRYLEAERFKKARFTTVFVHGTFVKGKSKVVLSPEDSEKDVVILEGV